MIADASTLSVLHLCSIKGRGGTGYMAGRVARLLHEAGHTVTVGACAGSKMEGRAREAGIPTLDGLKLRRGFHPIDLWRDVATVRSFLRKERVDILHSWHSIEYWTAALAVLGTPTKLVRTRGLVTPLRGHIFNKMIHARTAVVFATCGRIEEEYRKAGFGMANVMALVDGVDTTRFHPEVDGTRVRSETGIPAEAFVVASVGRLESVKDHGTLLAALAHMPDDAHALLAGDGSCREALEQQAKSLNLSGRVHFLGVRDDIPDVLAAADAYCLCSTGSEGSSRATLEAMACGLPCVTTFVGMLPDIVKPGRSGLLFTAGDAEALAECLENLQMDNGLRRRLGRGALELVQAGRTEASMLASVEAAYRHAVGRGG